MSDGKVTRLKPAEKPPLEIIEKERHCYHRFYRTRLDRDARRVYCANCGEEIDAFSVLEWMADGFKAKFWTLKKIEEFEEKERQRKKDAKGVPWAKARGWGWNKKRGIWEKYRVGFVMKRGSIGAPQWTGARYLGGGGQSFLKDDFETMQQAMEAVQAVNDDLARKP